MRAGGEDGDEVVRQDPGLAHRVLGGGRAGGRGVLAGQVWYGGAVSRRPGAVDDDAVAGDLERGQGGDPPAPLDGPLSMRLPLRSSGQTALQPSNYSDRKSVV